MKDFESGVGAFFNGGNGRTHEPEPVRETQLTEPTKEASQERTAHGQIVANQDVNGTPAYLVQTENAKGEPEKVLVEKGKDDSREVLRFVPRMAPVKAGIFPLLKKNEEQVRIAREIQKKLQPWMTVFYDDGGSVGKRYRRQDECGTPFCITVDFDTLGENGPELKGTVTIRHRDSMEQERLPVDALLPWLLERVR